MHREIIDEKENEHVDHINGNKKDNRKSNLRIATSSQNSRNIGLRKNNTTGYKGVIYEKKRDKWRAEIKKDYKSIFLGYFDTKEDAAKAYNEASMKYHGEFANLNNVMEDDNMEKKISVLDKGYVILHDVLGSDLTVANAARVSYNKKKDFLDEKDEKLIKFLANNDHTSPFRHATLQFEVYAPLMVARQWFKYIVGADHTMDAWNESSRRYITEESEFYFVQSNEWRSKPENSKQGSGEPIDPKFGEQFSQALNQLQSLGEGWYQKAINEGIAPEQARLFLPAYGLYVRWYWTTSLQGLAHFLGQRLEHDAQFEIQKYAQAVYELSVEKFPYSIQQLLNK